MKEGQLGKEITGILGMRTRGTTIASFLRKKLGGSWKYDGRSAWRCSDGIRMVRRVRSRLSCGKEHRWYGAKYFLYRLEEDGSKAHSQDA